MTSGHMLNLSANHAKVLYVIYSLEKGFPIGKNVSFIKN